MATLVTGGTGFVGLNIVKELAVSGHQVVSFDLRPPDALAEDFLRSHNSQIQFALGDVLDRETIAGLVDQHSIDKIVHAAVYTVNDVRLETESSQEIIDINIAGTTNLLELARTAKTTRFVYVSSGSAYGTAAPPDQTLNETTPPAPQNLYGITKYVSELLTRRYGQLHQISTASVRLSTPYGPMERVTRHRAVMSMVYDWTRQVARGEDIRARDLDQGRDYTYVADIADGIRTILDAPNLPHDLYNLTNGVWFTFRQILEALQEVSPGIRVVELPLSEPGGQQGAPLRGPLSGHRIFADLNWLPKYDLRAGLTEYLQWRRDSGFHD